MKKKSGMLVYKNALQRGQHLFEIGPQSALPPEPEMIDIVDHRQAPRFKDRFYTRKIAKLILRSYHGPYGKAFQGWKFEHGTGRSDEEAGQRPAGQEAGSYPGPKGVAHDDGPISGVVEHGRKVLDLAWTSIMQSIT